MLGVFRKILDMSLTGSIVIAVVLLARVFLRRAPKIYSYLLWSVVLFRLLCPLSISAQVSVLKPIPVKTSPGVSSVSYGFQQSIRGSSPAPTASTEVSSVPIAEKKALAPMEIVAWVWLAGTAGMAVYSLGTYWKLKKRLSEAVPLEDNVYIADGISTPFVMGLVRPKIYLPVHTPEGNRPFILAHEKHHIQRGDHVWKMLAYGALCLHWFNPLVWLSFCLAGKDMEMSCDEAVLKTLGETVRADYAQALLRLSGHRKISVGMPLAFGEGNTRGRILNLAHWRRPKVWVSALCVVLCLAVLTACALNPKQEEKSLEELTRIQGPAGVGVGELYFTLPEGCAMEAQEEKNADTANGLVHWITDGTETIGGVKIYTAPENLEQQGLDGISLLPLSEWNDSSLGWYADGDWNEGVSVEFFSDVPEGQTRTLLNVHNLYLWDGLVYDLWFDELVAQARTMEEIQESVRLGQRTAQDWEIGTLPEGYSTERSGDGLEIRKDQTVVGGVTSYAIPAGVYDAGDTAYLWLEKVGIPDLEDTNLQVAGMFAWDGSNGCQMTVTDDYQNPKIRRIHYFTVSGSTVYDLWLDDLLVEVDTQYAIQTAIRFPAQAPTEEETPENLAFSRCQAVMDRAQEGNIEVLRVCDYQNTPGQNYTEDFLVDDEIGGLWRTQTADGQTKGALYLYGDENDRYFEGQGQPLDWKETEIPDNLSEPWMGTFSFLKAYVTYQDTLTTETGFTDLFRVDLPFEDSPDAAPVYWASFDFDADGNFLSVTVQVNAAMDNAFTLTESVVTMDRAVIAGEIRQAAEEAEK